MPKTIPQLLEAIKKSINRRVSNGRRDHRSDVFQSG
jgi:hypothetical protein